MVLATSSLVMQMSPKWSWTCSTKWLANSKRYDCKDYDNGSGGGCWAVMFGLAAILSTIVGRDLSRSRPPPTLVLFAQAFTFLAHKVGDVVGDFSCRGVFANSTPPATGTGTLNAETTSYIHQCDEKKQWRPNSTGVRPKIGWRPRAAGKKQGFFPAAHLLTMENGLYSSI
jgi:hypothetical protein